MSTHQQHLARVRAMHKIISGLTVTNASAGHLMAVQSDFAKLEGHFHELCKAEEAAKAPPSPPVPTEN